MLVSHFVVYNSQYKRKRRLRGYDNSGGGAYSDEFHLSKSKMKDLTRYSIRNNNFGGGTGYEDSHSFRENNLVIT